MQEYRRNIDSNLYLLRAYFVAGLIICIHSFRIGFENIGYLAAVLLIFSSLIRVTQMVIDAGSLQIRKYYFFGLIPVTWRFQKGGTEKIELHRKFDHLPNTDESATAAGCLLPIFLYFTNVKYQWVSVIYAGKRNKKRWLETEVNDREFKLISQLLETK